MTELSPTSRRARDRIRTVAMVEFRSRGFWATTMDHIRVAAELSRGGLYYQYPSTEAILLDLVDTERTTDDALAAPGAFEAFLAEQRASLLKIDETVRPVVYEYVLGLPSARRREMLREQFAQARDTIDRMLTGTVPPPRRAGTARRIVRRLEGLSMAAIAGVLTEADLDEELADIHRMAKPAERVRNNRRDSRVG